MSPIPLDQLKKHIVEILETADLSVLTSKRVRVQLEKKLGCSLLDQKKQIDNMVMTEINKKNNESESESDADDNNDVDMTTKPEDSSSEEDTRPKRKRAAAPPAKKTKAKAKESSGPKKGTGFTRPYNLSPELAALMGADALPRHAVVKKIWSIIKERNLYDPKNKQYAICDNELMGVMKIKRFRTFGMLKYLKPHFIN